MHMHRNKKCVISNMVCIFSWMHKSNHNLVCCWTKSLKFHPFFLFFDWKLPLINAWRCEMKQGVLELCTWHGLCACFVLKKYHRYQLKRSSIVSHLKFKVFGWVEVDKPFVSKLAFSFKKMKLRKKKKYFTFQKFTKTLNTTYLLIYNLQ